MPQKLRHTFHCEPIQRARPPPPPHTHTHAPSLLTQCTAHVLPSFVLFALASMLTCMLQPRLSTTHAVSRPHEFMLVRSHCVAQRSPATTRARLPVTMPAWPTRTHTHTRNKHISAQPARNAASLLGRRMLTDHEPFPHCMHALRSYRWVSRSQLHSNASPHTDDPV